MKFVVHISGVLFFFFKQKTAYEIVSRDWSSDVCSSDLGAIGTLYAAKLATECGVTLVTRRPDQAAAINASGVRIDGLDETTARIAATTAVSALEPGSLLVLTTKVYDNASAIQPFADIV